MKEDKILAFGEKARQKLFEGVELLATAVCTTLGPKGRNVAIQRTWGDPFIVHDGVTVAREVGDKDEFKLMGIDLVKQAAAKTNEEAGDGTTTATLLAYEIIKSGLTLVKEGMNPMVLRNQINEVLPKLVAELDKISTPIKSSKDIARVAHISSGDKEIGEMVSKAIKKVGEDGLVTVEEGQDLTEIEYTEGMEFDKGYLSPYFITNPMRMEAVIENPAIAIVNRKITTVPEIQALFEPMSKLTKDLVLIAFAVSGDALVTMVVNKQKGIINALAIKAPTGGAGQIEHFLDDIAVLTGGKVINNDEDMTEDGSWIGRADKIIADKDTTLIVKGRGKKEDIESRIKAIKGQIEKEDNIHLKEALEERLAKLTRGVAVIKVGAKTEVDMREKVERVKDAVGAATSAREEGVVVGGGTAFLKLRDLVYALGTQDDVTNLLMSVLESPTRKLMYNAGEDKEAIEKYLKKIAEKGGNWGYEVEEGKIVDLVKEGIIDPTKVVRLALENAVAVATSLLTTDVLIAINSEAAKEKLKGQRR